MWGDSLRSYDRSMTVLNLVHPSSTNVLPSYRNARTDIENGAERLVAYHAEASGKCQVTANDNNERLLKVLLLRI